MKVSYRGSGKVLLLDKEYRCDLYYNDDMGGALIKIDYPKRFGSLSEFPMKLSYMSGNLDNGFKFTLFRAYRTQAVNMTSYGKTVYTYEVDYIFCGVESANGKELLFNKAEYTISEIVEWGCESLYEIDNNYALSNKKNLPDICLYSNDEYSINYTLSGSFLPYDNRELLRDNINIEQRGEIIISSNKGRDFEFFEKVFRSVKGLIELSMLRQINIERLNLFSEDLYESYGDFKINIPVRVHGYNIIDKEIAEYNYSSNMIQCVFLPDLIKNQSFTYYFEKYKLLEPVIELYLELFEKDNSNIRRFLNVVQALETFHSRFVTNDIAEYRKRVNEITKNDNPEIESRNKRLLEQKKGRNIILKSRIADLLYAEGDVYFETDQIDRESFPDIIAKTRNYYIHYDEKIKEEYTVLEVDELGRANNTLCFILEYYIFKEIGFEVNNIEFREKLMLRWRRF